MRLLAVLLLSLLAACSTDAANAADGDQPISDLQRLRSSVAALEVRSEKDTPYVRVQHCLIGFEESLQGSDVTRSQAEAEALTARLYKQLLDGADFDEIVREHTNDSAPGIYEMTLGTRSTMVQAFGDTGWRLDVGEIGVAPYHARKSPFGWHIVKRLD